MGHIFILIHIMSFISGISLISILSMLCLKDYRYSREKDSAHPHLFFRTFMPKIGVEVGLKQKSITIKFLLIADILYTVSQGFETVLLYLRKNIDNPPVVLNTVCMYVMLFTLLMAIFFVKKSIDSLNKGVSRISSIAKSWKCDLAFILIILVCLLLLGIYEAVLYIGIALLAILVIAYLIINFKAFSEIEQRALIVALIACSGVLLFSNLTSFNNSLPYIIYKIPAMPVLYFCLNTIGIIIVMPKLLENAQLSVSVSTSKMKDISQYKLTQRELEIIPLIIEGKSNAQIAEKLFISVNTVKNHVYNLYKKLEIKTRYELLSMMQQAQNSTSNKE